ncbi:hypothetical protein ERHA54_50440 (plasmid) [Erwinia rhapontici]|nr:DUF29 domain-containing protein [Erwinia rhapontici]BCQ42441.1 hypothetical protein ERHA54_50440 [Erwinia rhapontici]
MNTRYDADIFAWAQDPASLLRAIRFSEIDMSLTPNMIHA